MPDELNDLKHTWLAWVAGGLLVIASSYNAVVAHYRTMNGFIVDCIAWIDYSAIWFGSLSFIVFTVFSWINYEIAVVNWKTWLRRFAMVDAARVFLFGLGFDVGTGTGCDYI